MKKLILFLSLLLPLSGSARMFPMQMPIDVVCWDNVSEALSYHQDVLGEFPIGRGNVPNVGGPTFSMIMFNPKKPSWSYLHFHKNRDSGKVIVCSMNSGDTWQILTDGMEGEFKLL